MWRLTLSLPADAAAGFEAALAPFADAISRFVEMPGCCRIEVLRNNAFEVRALDLSIALVAAAAGIDRPAVAIEALPVRDWLAENRERFSAFRIGRFHIREPDDPTPCPLGLIDLQIEAASAFGSGRHGSTEGCLWALSDLSRYPVGHPIDVGCGSGILAIAAAKLWRVPVMACDVDPAAVAVARANARLNGVAPLVRVVVADGWRASSIADGAPYDLVLCNILARPLRRLAGDLARHIAPGGIAALAGLLVADGADVLASYQAFGLRLIRRIDVEGWRTLLLRRPMLRAGLGVP